MTQKTYNQVKDELYKDSLTEGFEIWGEDHEGDAHQHAHEAIYEWQHEYPESGDDWKEWL